MVFVKTTFAAHKFEADLRGSTAEVRVTAIGERTISGDGASAVSPTRVKEITRWVRNWVRRHRNEKGKEFLQRCTTVRLGTLTLEVANSAAATDALAPA